MNLCSLILVSLLSLFLDASPYQANGKASFYSDRMQGQRTSSGERYDKTLFTAAHATLPFNTLVKVTNTDNGKSVVVRINDRMARKRHTIIDVSRAAAREIGLVRAGVAPVKLKEVKKMEPEQQEAPLAVSETAAVKL
ncbi:septal ring lytic transglycosylase RlpA family protein [Pontibacter sp. SGAir0037]|uniref:septal ring lytic transglycosylase RlpA family protein n=1 Tax=Pontibacter sp. SGAir0037 TaxID=2571030 RepID=UPI0010CCB27C|nr:septal ring lytic transglycosylase RlpA family protein [Pontibacter sp. SGAir0037]QCR22432.1 septal ring lytic transglycosylase RlpA family lipoprotein [Pontibacter sp. SGAir0037]